MSGLFITFEGIEGCGKSTQIERLRTWFEQHQREVVVTREPGGTPTAEVIRQLLLDPNHAALTARAELLLYAAARAQHVEERIRPALERDAVVLCDRFADSTTAYQGGGRGLDMALIKRIHEIACNGLTPDLTFFLDVPVDVGLARASGRGEADRIEMESLDFHQRVRDGFLALAAAEPERIQVIDGHQSQDAVADAIRTAVEQRTGLS